MTTETLDRYIVSVPREYSLEGMLKRIRILGVEVTHTTGPNSRTSTRFIFVRGATREKLNRLEGTDPIRGPIHIIGNNYGNSDYPRAHHQKPV